MGTGSCTAGAARAWQCQQTQTTETDTGDRDLKQKFEGQCGVKQLAPSDSLVTEKDVDKAGTHITLVNNIVIQSFSVLQVAVGILVAAAPCSAQVFNSVGHVLRRHCFQFNSLEGLHHLLPLGCQFTQYCSCAWAIRQVAVEDAFRRKIRQYRHGFGYARSATMMDGSLTIVILSATEVVTRTQVAERTHINGHHNVPGKMSGKSQKSCPVVSVLSVNTPPAQHVADDSQTLQLVDNPLHQH